MVRGAVRRGAWSPPRPGETYLEALGRLREAQLTAESEVMRQVRASLEKEPASVWQREPEWIPVDAPVELSEDELLVLQEREAERQR
jgi:hypothetical protein